LGKVSDAQLQFLYECAEALVQPSFSEGFGLTGVEALQCGTKVLASDIAVFREVYGEAFFAFDPTDVTSFLAALDTSRTISASKFAFIAKQQATKFNWQHCVKEVAQIYQKLLSVL
jgi:glycosyltransferase involved in cell wall biosynthesis